MYLVDGNNVMGQRVGWHRDKRGAQKRLLGELSGFSRQGHEVTVAFDGPPPPGTRDGDLIDGVRVHFARRGRDADDRILELASRAVGDSLVAVTSDRRLSERLGMLGVETMRSGTFRRLLDEGQDAPH